MKPPQPFSFLSETAQRRFFILFFIATLLLSVALTRIGAPLATPAAPYGILSFEFAGNNAAARAMIDSWGAQNRINAGLSLGLDFLFLCTYPLAISLACFLIARALERRNTYGATPGLLLAWALLGMAPLDALENWALIQLLQGGTAQGLAPLASGCATFKFLLLAAGLLYLFSLSLAFAWRAFARRKA